MLSTSIKILYQTQPSPLPLVADIFPLRLSSFGNRSFGFLCGHCLFPLCAVDSPSLFQFTHPLCLMFSLQEFLHFSNSIFS